MNFSKNEPAIIRDKPMEGQIRLDEELLLPKPQPQPSAELTVFADEEPKRSKYAFSEPEDEKSADTKAKVILVSRDHGTVEDEDSEEAFEEFDLAEYELTPWENFEICSNCSECETVEICHRGRKRR